MHLFVRGGTLRLLLGDLCVFVGSLVLTLLVRYQAFPKADVFEQHIQPFLILFAIWILVFLIAGLYDRYVSIIRKSIPQIVIKAQVFNILCAALFFFFVPVGIEPKTNLVIYLGISTILIIAWRLFLYPRLTASRPMRALIIGDSEEAIGIARVFARNPFFKNINPFVLSKKDIPDFEEFRSALLRFNTPQATDLLIADMRDPFALKLVNDFYALAFGDSNVRFFNLAAMYEELHHRIPPSLIHEAWFLENITNRSPHYAYEVLKRFVDVVFSLILLIPCMVIAPFVCLAIYLDDRGPFLYRAERVGQFNRHIFILKFRTMTGTDSSRDALKSTLEVTRVGRFLRKTRIDELPQIWNVLRGDLSFIGPRPEIPTLVAVYSQEIPYYTVRHMMKPGLSGWAQINNFDVPRGGVDVSRTIEKLSFDLYYLKHRSFALDVEIALKTLNTLLLRSGT